MVFFFAYYKFYSYICKMDEKIIESLEKKIKDLNKSKSLLTFMKEVGVSFKDASIINAYGIATFDSIFLDIEKLTNDVPERLFYFIILHEIAHYKRIKKMGREAVIKNLSSDDMDILHKHLLYEEIFADRYASLLYYRLTGELYPKTLTQQLDNPFRQEEYRIVSKTIFGRIQNDENKYNELLNSFIK